jgi:3-methyladenine DNA glycosylase AlkD
MNKKSPSKFPSASDLIQAIQAGSNDQKAQFFQSFFRTGPGGYAESDQFLGLTVPNQRLIAKQFSNLPLNELSETTKSPFHELRLTSLLILVNQYNKAIQAKNLQEAQTILEFYINHTPYINNWDLVDSSADKILGHWTFTHPKDQKILKQFSKSKSIWEKRIAMISCFYFIRQESFQLPLHIAETLLSDKHDLIHKAVGWMLREIGKRNLTILDEFLTKHYQQLPRTTLRYAIEKHPEAIRKKYLLGQI